MFRVGLVKEQDPSNCRVRVTFPDHDQMVSWWLPVIVAKTQNDKSYHLPDLGEQVVCLMDEYDEDGAVLGAIYSTVDIPPVQSPDKWHLSMKDGAIFEYDRNAHQLTIALPLTATIDVTANNASLNFDAAGNISLITIGQIALAGGGPAVARVGDTTVCPAGQGTITSGSSKVTAGG